ncbi:DUF998 domain-containing protein [Myxococcus sp. K15C18031901]|uniref:DUF998 domain-containing protein n=1 Tax=Myxococcus dinghuensis TaxID=2906761 RepID=UPI0020A783D8|nr:DUF998 domain-containing protein [Myxococcus dinghuensis]MCP3097371.1 DUF998 domain-containing protein [Myxococcus dinghuensis]
MAPWVLVSSLVSVTLSFAPVWWFARRRPDYSHLRNTISELGETGAKDAKRVAWLAFAPAGASVIVFAALLRTSLAAYEDVAGPLRAFSLLGVSYLGAAVFPCDEGAPPWGTWRNQMHNLVAVAGYGGAGAGLIELGRALEDIAPVAALATLTATVGKGALLGVFGLSLESPVRGLLQRVLEGALFGWMVLMGAWLLSAG